MFGIDPYVAVFILVPAFFVLGYALQRFVIGPASHGDDRNMLLVTLGLSVVIENVLLYAFRADTRTIDVSYGFSVVPFAGMFLSVPRLAGFAGAVVVALLLWLLLTFTDIGKAIRAVAKEKLGAQLSGIDVAHIYAVTFGLGTACVAIAACLLIPTYYVNPHVGNAFVLIAFTIVVLGGMGSIPGALIGGLFVGVVESLCGLYLGESLGQIGIFVMFILVLLFRPSGLAGRAGMSRAGFLPIVAAVVALACIPFVTDSNVVLNFLVTALLITLAGQGWNVLGGYGGQYSFGHAAFFGTGAYVTAILQVRYGLNAWPAFAVGIAAGAAVGAVIGVLTFRSGLRGSYFALVTLAFAEVLRIVASVAPITGAGVGTLIKLDLGARALQFQSRAAFYWIILALGRDRAGDHQTDRAIALRRLAGGGARERRRGTRARCRCHPRQARRDDDLGRDDGGRRLLLCAVFSVPRCGDCLRPVDFRRSAAGADHRRRRHCVRTAARCADGQDARRGGQACHRRCAGSRPCALRCRADPGGRFRAARRGRCHCALPRMVDAAGKTDARRPRMTEPMLAVEGVSKRFGGSARGA